VTGVQTCALPICDIEINILKKPIGKQDQYIAAYGGFRSFSFYPSGRVENAHIICKETTVKKMQSYLLLLYTGITRSADNVLHRQMINVKKAKYREKINLMIERTEKMQKELSKNNIGNFGKILASNWELKKNLAEGITNSKIDKWYNVAKQNGAEGGKILGAGGGGFLLLFAEPKFHSKIKKALRILKPVAFKFEPEGSKIIFIEN